MNDRTSAALVDNSQSAILAAIEVHNKPIFAYRYEVCVILLINSWELIMKAFLIEKRTDIKIFNEDGSTAPFEHCVVNVLNTLGKNFLTSSENVNKLYDYRCNVIHFYQDNIDVILYSLISKSVILYHEFLLEHFGIDLSERTNLILLPIGFKRPISPIDYLTNESIINESSEMAQKFIKGIVESTHLLSSKGVEDSILVNYRMSVMNENRVKNADVIAAITKNPAQATVAVDATKSFRLTEDESAQKLRIEEDNLFKTIYTETYNNVTDYAQENYSDFKMNRDFHLLLRELKENPSLHRVRYLDVSRESGTKKDYYSKEIYKEFDKRYKRVK